MGCGNGAMQVAGLAVLRQRSLPGRFEGSLRSLGVPPVLSYGTCTDTGRLADLLLSDLQCDGRAGDRPAGRCRCARVHGTEGHHRRRFCPGFGLYTYVNPVPTVTGGPNLVKLLTEDLKD